MLIERRMHGLIPGFGGRGRLLLMLLIALSGLWILRRTM